MTTERGATAMGSDCDDPVMVLTDVERRILAVTSQRTLHWGELGEAVGTSEDEAESASKSLCEKGLLVVVVPLGGPNIRAVGGWEITPSGHDALRAARETR
jgi:hypothetical protein